jgi:hypothetical protein
MNDIFSTAKAYSVVSGATADEQRKRKQSQSTSQDCSQSSWSLFAVNVIFSAAKANSSVGCDSR